MKCFNEKLKIESFIGIYDKNNNSFIRKNSGFVISLPEAVNEKSEYAALAFDVESKSESLIEFSEVYVTVNDDKTQYGWRCDYIGPKEKRLFQLYEVAMHSARYGINVIKLYFDKELIAEQYFVISDKRVWQKRMKFPTAEQIANSPEKVRSAYIVFEPTVPKNETWAEYSVDFRIDNDPKATYVCLCNWCFDYSNVSGDYRVDENGHISGYCGFQVLDDGRKVAILSLWDKYKIDKNGKRQLIHAKGTFPANGELSSFFSGEGEGVHTTVPYDWKRGAAYRMRLTFSPSEKTGTTLVTMFICDLAANQWTKLIEYDTCFDNLSMAWNCSFLENYLIEYSGEVRTVEMSNIRMRSAKTNKWFRVKDGKNRSLSDIGGILFDGRYEFGKDDGIFWIITAGV